jgi:hypothetical protein
LPGTRWESASPYQSLAAFVLIGFFTWLFAISELL